MNSPETVHALPDRAQQFWAQVQRNDDLRTCWTWTGARNASGQPVFALAAGHVVRAIDFAWIDTFKRSLAGHVLVACGTQDCCNPHHAAPFMPSSQTRLQPEKQAEAAQLFLARWPAATAALKLGVHVRTVKRYWSTIPGSLALHCPIVAPPPPAGPQRRGLSQEQKKMAAAMRRAGWPIALIAAHHLVRSTPAAVSFLLRAHDAYDPPLPEPPPRPERPDGRRKLTDQQRSEILQALERGARVMDLAMRYGVTAPAIYYVRNYVGPRLRTPSSGAEPAVAPAGRLMARVLAGLDAAAPATDAPAAEPIVLAPLTQVPGAIPLAVPVPESIPVPVPDSDPDSE